MLHFCYERRTTKKQKNSLLDVNMKTGIYLLVLSEICVEISKASIKLKTPQKEKENKFWEINNNVNIAEDWHNHKNMSKPFEKQGLEDFTLYNFTEKTANFGFNLYRKIAMTHDNNVIISPLSVSTLMTAYMLAAKGETHRQIAKGLNLHALKDTVDRHHLPALFKQLKDNITMNDELLVQGTLSFIQKDFRLKESFLNLSKQYFDMEFLRVDFQNFTQAKLVINQNIKKRTKGKIPELFEELDRHTKLLLVDYIVFKGKWVYPFNSKFTEMETFHINKYRSVQVPMMFKSDKVNSTFDENLRCTVIKLPYKGKAHMLIVIPEKEGDYISLEDHLTTEVVEFWLGNMKTRKVDISFPKFKLEQKYKLKKLLHALGIKNLFTRMADLGHLTDQGYVAVSQVVQKAVIEVDEEGTEATAASGSEITAFTVPPVIKVDRPFLFMIFEETFKTLLFIGRVVDPTEM
ncbi:protein Z-dependent protease inhibitor isoform X1 [Columba livia]|uniref:Serpin peptidase inhibitor, clade A (Alpha-1 antiproteinase, antitrypsin), member 10, transcript variant X1 n=2 Tax=Columba livia TaxID=8932 RepID=A0A2I0MP08_COLLI|nr:protein Z-dependent protease inhibitor isoform X1 [Columba livia]PKK31413.1 serpin peptidase inhibitor, clade A (alpha-1 antiproteinase, antitrypsin), member 10, transcript variant X1 [Columba livia]